jgi:hypothetical protein
MALELDAATLRDKYGEPLARETFQVRHDLEMVVSYGPAGQVCRIQLPHSPSRQQVDEVINELVPPSVRGKETGRGHWITGGHSTSYILYEHIAIFEHEGGVTSVTISFKRSGCNSPNPNQYHEA